MEAAEPRTKSASETHCAPSMCFCTGLLLDMSSTYFFPAFSLVFLLQAQHSPDSSGLRRETARPDPDASTKEMQNRRWLLFRGGFLIFFRGCLAHFGAMSVNRLSERCLSTEQVRELLRASDDIWPRGHRCDVRAAGGGRGHLRTPGQLLRRGLRALCRPRKGV